MVQDVCALRLGDGPFCFYSSLGEVETHKLINSNWGQRQRKETLPRHSCEGGFLLFFNELFSKDAIFCLDENEVNTLRKT